jgi:excisionase family DNA binding protein
MSRGPTFADGVANFAKERFGDGRQTRQERGDMPANKDPDIGAKNRLLNVRQAANYLGTTAASLYTKVWRREISFIKLGRSVRFDVKDLDALIELSRVSTREFSMIQEKWRENK